MFIPHQPASVAPEFTPRTHDPQRKTGPRIVFRGKRTTLNSPPFPVIPSVAAPSNPPFAHDVPRYVHRRPNPLSFATEKERRMHMPQTTAPPKIRSGYAASRGSVDRTNTLAVPLT
jgi:hypothetical protein